MIDDSVIKQHDFTDSNIVGVSADNYHGHEELIVFDLDIEDGEVTGELGFNREDAIAIAKHFKLTQDDLT